MKSKISLAFKKCREEKRPALITYTVAGDNNKKNSLKSQFKFNNINSKSRFIEFLINQNNDLQLVVEKKYPAIKTLIEEIGKKEGCYFSRMTGSGSACYGVFESEKVAKAALNGIKLKYPKYWSSVAKTI